MCSVINDKQKYISLVVVVVVVVAVVVVAVVVVVVVVVVIVVVVYCQPGQEKLGAHVVRLSCT